MSQDLETDKKGLQLSAEGTRLSIYKEFFLYRLHYGRTQLPLDEYHEFVEYMNNYNIQYKDILIYRKNYSIAMVEKTKKLSQRFLLYTELMQNEVNNYGTIR